MSHRVETTSLQQAINSASTTRLREVLLQIVTESASANKLATSKLLIDQTTKKRKSVETNQRYETCGQCRKEYDVLNNPRNCCQYHEGEMECDYESEEWADWDEDCHGEMDTKENRKAFPQNFMWTCCDRAGDDPGCMVGVHRPRSMKRARS